MIGLLLALALAQVLSSLLIGISGYDVTTFILVPTLLAAVALVACYLPARRATKVDPLVRSDMNRPMDSLIKNIRYAFRSLVRQPAFTLVTVITLALGIGANTAIFSIVHSVLLKPLPFNRSDRIVVLWGEDRSRRLSQSGIAH